MSANFQKTLDPSDGRTHQLIGTLETLKLILDSQQFGPAQLQTMQAELGKIQGQIQSRISAIVGNNGRAPMPVSSLPFSSAASDYPLYSTPPPQNPIPPAFVTQPPSMQPTPLPQTLAALLGSLPPPTGVTPKPQIAPQPPADNSLIAQLRAAGLLNATPPPAPAAVQKPALSGRYGVVMDQESITKM
jgi:hypothetical protein